MNPSGTNQRYALRHLHEVAQIQALVCAEMQAKNYPLRDIFSVRLALEESLTNAIKHGNEMDGSKQVRVAFRVSDRSVWIRVEDEGDGFAVADVADPTEPDRLDRVGGRGLHIMRAFMCAVQYNQRGNQVTMCKRRSNAPLQHAQVQ